MLHKCIFLILSSNDNPIYAELKKLHVIYLKNYVPLIRFYFVEFRKDQEEIVIENDNHIYIQGEESINPGMILKTCKAIEYLNEHYNYEFIVRTNLSTFFYMQNLLEYLLIIPSTNSCGGFNYRNFITGTGIFLSRDVANQIVELFLNYNIMDYNEDLIISGILHKLKTPFYNCKKFYKWGLIIDETTENYGEYYFMPTNGEFKDIDFPNSILHFRIKNSSNRALDIQYFKLLLNKIYNIIV